PGAVAAPIADHLHHYLVLERIARRNRRDPMRCDAGLRHGRAAVSGSSDPDPPGPRDVFTHIGVDGPRPRARGPSQPIGIHGDASAPTAWHARCAERGSQRVRSERPPHDSFLKPSVGRFMVSKYRAHLGGRSRRSLIPALALLVASAGAAISVTAATAAADDGRVIDQTLPAPSIPMWDAVGVSSARSTFASDAKVLRVVLAAGDHASFTRRTGPSPGSAFRVVFDMNVSGVGADQRVTQVFRLGSQFDAANADAPEASTYARLSLDATESGFRLRDPISGHESAWFSGTQAVTWALNDSDHSVSYAAPDGSIKTLAHDRMDVCVGAHLVIGDG